MRVWHLILLPGETVPPHRHDRPYFWTVLSGGKGRARYADGRFVDHHYEVGETKNYPDLSPDNAFIHDLTNTGMTPLILVTVEFEH